MSVEEEVVVKAMQCVGRYWRWPQKDHELPYHINEIVKYIAIPNQVNSHGHYQVPELI